MDKLFLKDKIVKQVLQDLINLKNKIAVLLEKIQNIN
jgi:hypothetical protein